MSRRPPLLLLLFLLPAVLASKPPATPPQLVDFDWRGEDVVLVFGDSVGYEVDLAESDTAQVVLRFGSLAISEALRQRTAGAEAAAGTGAPSGGVAISIGGRNGRAAVFSQRGADASLRVHDDERLGYSIEWRPYTRQLVVHTFEWDRLGYAESQFHQGLIALEQNVVDQAEELLQVANASGEERAGAVLASLYARRGADSLARYFLRSPGSAEEHAALAALQLRAGDSVEAQESLARSERALASGQERGRRSRGSARGRDGRVLDDDGYSGGGSSRTHGDGGMADRDVILLAAVGGLALLLIIGLIVLSMRRGRKPPVVMTPPGGAPITPPPPPRRSEPAGFRVVEKSADDATRAAASTGAASAAGTTPTAGATPVAGATPAAGTAHDASTAPVAGTAPAAGTAPVAGNATAAGTAPATATATPFGTAPSVGTAPTPGSTPGVIESSTSVESVRVESVSAASAPPPAGSSDAPASASAATTSAASTAGSIDPDTVRPSAQTAHIPMPTQAEELLERIREEERRAYASGSTIEAARRMQVSRDNIELRRMMEAASGRRSTQG